MTGLVSSLAPHIESLLAVKHALGLPYTTSGRHLQVFDAMCAEHYPEQAELTRPMAMAWAKARAGEHVNGQMRRITPVRQLAKHMAMLGVQAYVIPAGIPGRQVRYCPHVYTPVELRAIFDAADQIRATPFGGRRELIIPAIFRMIYCLGLRPGEARRQGPRRRCLHPRVERAQGPAGIPVGGSARIPAWLRHGHRRGASPAGRVLPEPGRGYLQRGDHRLLVRPATPRRRHQPGIRAGSAGLRPTARARSRDDQPVRPGRP
jgi:integrase